MAWYARDLTRNRWRCNGEPIQIDTNGTLINGRHRLNAIVPTAVVKLLAPQAGAGTGADRDQGIRVIKATAAKTLDTYSHRWPDSDDTTQTAVDPVLGKINRAADSTRTDTAC